MDPVPWTPNHYNLWHFETAVIQPVLTVNILNGVSFLGIIYNQKTL